MESSRVAKAAQEPKVNAEEGVCDFDLNREVCYEEMDHPMNSIPNHVIVVSASRAAAPLRLPLGPLQFACAHGFTAPSATSAFCPVIPRIFLESDKTLVSGGTCNIPQQQQQDFLDFDLNKAYSTEDEIANLIPGKQILVSEKSSVEVAPRRSEALMLDLNRRSNEDDASSDCNIEGLSFHHRDNQCRPSLFSSSLSMLRKIDDKQPSSFNDSANLQPYFGENRYSGGVRPFSDSGEVRLMGEHLRVNLQPASDSGRVGKRKGPEGGWEPYSSEDRHQPLWK